MTLPALVVLGAPGLDPPRGLERLEGRARVRHTDADRLPDDLPGADALLLWDHFSPALPAAWPSADRLRWVHVAAAGVDHLMFPGLVGSDVEVTNARGTFDTPIAEYVLGLLLAHLKDLPTTLDAQRAHRWHYRETRSLHGTVAVVVGTGSIGRAIARLLRAVGVRVRGVGRTARDGDPDFGVVAASADLATVVGDADHLVVAAPLTPSTRALVSATVLAALPARAHVVNVGRGPIVESAALVEAMRAGRLAAASLDVLDTEPLPADDPLWDVPGLLVSPHMSGDVVGWRDVLADQFLANAERFLAGEPLRDRVDKQTGFVPAGDGA